MHHSKKCDYSITSSARSRKDSGIVRPSTLAVVRLMIRSNLVACSDRDFGRPRPAQNPVDHVGGASKQVGEARPIGHQTSRFNVLSKTVHRWQPRPHRQDVNASPVGVHERVGTNIKSIRAAFERVKGGGRRYCGGFKPERLPTEASPGELGLNRARPTRCRRPNPASPLQSARSSSAPLSCQLFDKARMGRGKCELVHIALPMSIVHTDDWEMSRTARGSK